MASGDQMVQDEGVAAEHVDVVEPERREPGHILCPHVKTFSVRPETS
jgi:hypothetical protein